jgi:hypothetical protein
VFLCEINAFLSPFIPGTHFAWGMGRLHASLSLGVKADAHDMLSQGLQTTEAALGQDRLADIFGTQITGVGLV